MKKMKKLLIIVCVIIGFTALTLTPASAFPYHRYHYGSGAYWGGALLGLGILTAAILTSSYYNHPEPNVVLQPAPAVVLPPRPVVEQQVPSPVIPVPPPAMGKATVTAPLLNVRSGPGKGFKVLYQVSRGSILEIRGNAPGWYYVRLPNGQYGWVMTQFATPTALPANG